jgi:hypothetical protein
MSPEIPDCTYLKTSSLTSARLLLHRHDFQNFVVQFWAQESIDDLSLLEKTRINQQCDQIGSQKQ